MAQLEDSQSGAGAVSTSIPLPELSTKTAWFAGLGVILAVLVVCLLVWGPEMEFPTTVSTSEVATSGGGSVTLTKTVRQVTGNVIDEAVDWLTVEASWLFNGLSDGVTYALIFIEDILKWVPWPVIVLGLALLSFVVGRWSLLGFTTVALLFVGFMGLWENTLDTIALMVVSVVISVSIGLPLGVVAARSRLADNIMRPILDAMQTMPSFVYLLPGVLFFGLGAPAGVFATIIYAVPPVIRLTNLGIRQVSEEAVEAARSFGTTPLPATDKGAGPYGAAHDHGRHQPDHHDGVGDGDHRQHGRRGRSGRQRAQGATEEPAGQRRDRGRGHRVSGDHH